MEGSTIFGKIISAELILGNMGTVSVTVVVVKGHWSTSITLEITSLEWWVTSWVHGVESESIFGTVGTLGRT